MKKYEALFIFPSSLKEEAMAKVLERIREEIARLKGEASETQMIGRRSFCRPLGKLENGQYVKIVFAMDPAGIAPLKARFKLIEEVFRVQIVAVPVRKAKQEA